MEAIANKSSLFQAVVPQSVSKGEENTSSLSRSLKNVGRLSLIFYGVGLLLTSIGVFVAMGLSGQISVESIIGAVAYFVLLIGGILVISLGRKIGKQQPIFGDVMKILRIFSVFLLFGGISGIVWGVALGNSNSISIGGFNYSYSSPIATDALESGILFLVSSIFLLIAFSFYSKSTTASKTTGGVLGLIAIILVTIATYLPLNFGILTISGGSYFPGLSSLSALVHAYTGNPNSVTTFVYSGSSGFPGTVGDIGLVIAAVAAIVYVFMRNTQSHISKYALIPIFIGLAGVLLFGVDGVISTVGFLSSPIWSSGAGTLLRSSGLIAASIFLVIASIMIIASSGIGLAYYGRQFSSFSPSTVQSSTTPAISSIATQNASAQPGVAPQQGTPAQYGNNFCTKCGLQLKQGATFCGNCGTKVE